MRPSGVPRKSDEEIDEILRSRVGVVNMWIGFAALLVITWFMISSRSWSRARGRSTATASRPARSPPGRSARTASRGMGSPTSSRTGST